MALICVSLLCISLMSDDEHLFLSVLAAQPSFLTKDFLLSIFKYEVSLTWLKFLKIKICVVSLF